MPSWSALGTSVAGRSLTGTPDQPPGSTGGYLSLPASVEDDDVVSVEVESVMGTYMKHDGNSRSQKVLVQFEGLPKARWQHPKPKNTHCRVRVAARGRGNTNQRRTEGSQPAQRGAEERVVTQVGKPKIGNDQNP